MRRKRLIKNIVFTFGYQIIAIITGFILPKIIIQNYGSEVNGLINSIAQFLAYIYIAEGGVGVVVKYLLYKPIAKSDKNEIEKILKSAQRFLRHLLYIYILYVIVLCIIYPPIVEKSFERQFTIALILIIAISRFSEYYMAMEYNIYLQANQQNYIIAIFNIITVLAITIITIILIKLSYSIIAIKIASTIIFIIRAMCYKLYIKKKYDINLAKKIEKYKIEQRKDAFAQQIAYIIDSNIDVVLITYFLGTAEVSVYTVYMLVFKGLNNIITAITGGVDATFGDMFAKKEYDNANKKFTMYQFIYFFIITLLYNLCCLLIIPFVKIYTKGIIDTNYYRPVFAIIVTISEFLYAIKFPYEALIKSIGHFKQIKNISYIEAFINACISIVLVSKFELIGVAIGTLCAMAFKLCAVIWYFSKKVLKRSLKNDFKFLILMIIQSIIILTIGGYITQNACIISYFDCGILAIKLGIISLLVELIINYTFSRNIIKQIMENREKIF